MVDFRIEDCGSIVMVEPVSDAAKEWTDENVQVESWAWLGNRFSCDRRMADNLIDGIVGEGFEVEA